MNVLIQLWRHVCKESTDIINIDTKLSTFYSNFCQLWRCYRTEFNDHSLMHKGSNTETLQNEVVSQQLDFKVLSTEQGHFRTTKLCYKQMHIQNPSPV